MTYENRRGSLEVGEITTLERLSNEDGSAVNEDGKKAIGLDWQINNSARASRIFVHFLQSLHDYDVKMYNFKFCGELKHKTTTLLFFSLTLLQSFRIQLQKNLPTFDELNEME